MKNQKQRNIIWLIVLLVVIILGLVGYICYTRFYDQDKNDDSESYVYKIAIHKELNTYIVEPEEGQYVASEYDYYNYKCQSDVEFCSIYGVDPQSLSAIVKDNDSIFRYDLKKKKTIAVYDELKNYDFNKASIVRNSNNEEFGLKIEFYILADKDKDIPTAFYSFASKNVSEFKNDWKFEVDKYQNEWVLIGWFINKPKNDDLSITVMELPSLAILKTIPEANTFKSYKSGIYVTELCEGMINCKTTHVLNSNFDDIVKNFAHLAVNSDPTITYQPVGKNEFIVINSDGEELFKSGSYKEILDIYADYTLIRDNNKLQLVNKNGDIAASFDSLPDKYSFSSVISGWYSNKETNKAGIYIIVNDLTKKEGESGYTLEYYYIPSANDTGVIELDNAVTVKTIP